MALQDTPRVAGPQKKEKRFSMKIIVTEQYEESCLVAAGLIAEAVRANPAAKLGLATGGTPLPIYRHLIEMNRQGQLDFSQVRTVNLDEYCGLGGSHPQSYRYFMDTNLFNHININKANTFVPSGLGEPSENAAELDSMVYAGGVPAVQLLGVGNNGHIAFNEAGSHLTAASHIETLTESTLRANSRFFEKEEDVPTHAITMGLKGILASRCPLLVATGAAKAEAMRGLLLGSEVTTQNPSTFLKLHPGSVVVVDKALAALAGYPPAEQI